jgi:branched-chain amino acid transport system permease protein
MRTNSRLRGAVEPAATTVGLAILSFVAYYLLTTLEGDQGQVVMLIIAWTIAITGLNIVQGLGGYPSLAQASFYGCGAYLSTILAHHKMPIVAAAILGVLGTMVVGLVVAMIFGRTRGQYFAIGTLFFGAVTTLVLNNWASVTGGPNGMPVDLGFSLDTSSWLLPVSMGVGFLVFYFINRSRFGAQLRAIREDEDLAQHVGVPTARVKLMALLLSSAFGAWAGVLLAQYNGVIEPGQFTFGQSFLMFVAIGFGGYGRLLTPLIGSALVIGLTQLLHVGPGISQIVIGVIFVVVTLVAPGGILGGVQSAGRRVVRLVRARPEGGTA